jgi:hypothetical protein
MEVKRIELIKDVNKLSGSLYFEFQVGKHNGTHWSNDSVFIFEEYVCFIEPIFQDCLNNYWHYSFTDVSKPDWEKIISEINILTQNIRKSETFDDFSSFVKFYFKHNIETFKSDFKNQKSDLIKMLNELVLWLKDVLKTQNIISILGI